MLIECELFTHTRKEKFFSVFYWYTAIVSFFLLHAHYSYNHRYHLHLTFQLMLKGKNEFMMVRWQYNLIASTLCYHNYLILVAHSLLVSKFTTKEMTIAV